MPKRTNIYLPEEQIKRLKKIATKKDVSVSELVRRAIENFLEEQEKKGLFNSAPWGNTFEY